MQELRQPIAELQALLAKPNPNPNADPNPNPDPDPTPNPTPRLQARHALGGEGGEAAAAAELQALYAAHGVSPMRMLALPLVYLP